MGNKEFKVRPTLLNINGNDLSLYTYSVTLNICGGSYNDIDNSYSKLCVPDVFKDINIKRLNWMSRTNEIRYVS